MSQAISGYLAVPHEEEVKVVFSKNKEELMKDLEELIDELSIKPESIVVYEVCAKFNVKVRHERFIDLV